jgi:hypothetical protein
MKHGKSATVVENQKHPHNPIALTPHNADGLRLLERCSIFGGT